MSARATPAPAPVQRTAGFRYHLRVLHVVAAAEFKLKYAGSALGYIWSVVKPLAIFTVLYLVFGRLFNLREISEYYPLALLIGIVLHLFFTDATSLAMSSLVARDSLLRKMSFPRTIIPTSLTLTAALTFCVNLGVLAVFIGWNRIVPRWDWLLVLPLIAELYLFILGVSFLLAALFVHFRDIAQIWELVLTLLFYAAPIIYPVGFLPPEIRAVVFLYPFTQVMQDIRAIVLYPDLEPNKITAADALGFPGAHAIPIAIALGVFALGLWYFKRNEPWYAERV